MIEEIGKLGPLFTSLGSLVVAILVYKFNKQQTQWQNQVAVRAADLEDQKLRLNLLDRRQRSTEALRAAILSIRPDGTNVAEIAEQLSTVLREASLVFVEDDRADIEQLLFSVERFGLDLRMARQAPGFGRITPGSTTSRGPDLLEQHGINQTGDMKKRLDDLLKRLTESSRIIPVERLVPFQSSDRRKGHWPPRKAASGASDSAKTGR